MRWLSFPHASVTSCGNNYSIILVFCYSNFRNVTFSEINEPFCFTFLQEIKSKWTKIKTIRYKSTAILFIFFNNLVMMTGGNRNNILIILVKFAAFNYLWMKINITIMILFSFAFEFHDNDAESEMVQIRCRSARAYTWWNILKIYMSYHYILIISKSAGSCVKSLRISYK